MTTENPKRPLADYTVPVNELLDSGIAEVEEFGRNYMRRIFGIPSPPPTAPHLPISRPEPSTQEDEECPERRTQPLPLSQILAPQTPTPPPQPQLKRERHQSDMSDLSEDEDERLHAAGFLLNLASPEVSSRPESECGFSSSRKRVKSRYADTINMPFSQMVRPAYEYMTDQPAMGGVRYLRNPYSIPHSPPQSPPEMMPRLRARPGRCARKAQGCNENTKFRPVISDWTCYKNYEPCPKDSQVGWCNKCWCNKGHYSEEDFYRRKFELLEDQIAVWADEFRVPKFEVWLPMGEISSGSTVTTKTVIDAETAKRYVLRWREEWERTGRTPNIKIRPI